VGKIVCDCLCRAWTREEQRGRLDRVVWEVQVVAVRAPATVAGRATTEARVANVNQAAAQLIHTGSGLAAPTAARDLHVVLVIYMQLCQLLARAFFAKVHCEAVRTRLAIACAGAPENRIALGRFERADKGRLVRRCARQKCLPLRVAESGAHLPRNARPRCTDERAPALLRALARHQAPREQAAAQPEGRKHALGAPAVRGRVRGERNVAPLRRGGLACRRR